MMRKLGWMVAAVVALLLAAPAFPCDLHGMGAEGGNCFFGEGDGFDLSQLADGETRYFGPQERAVAVTRGGDEVVMTITGDGGETHEIKCNVVEDSCLLLESGEGGQASLMISSSHGLHGEGLPEFLFVDDEDLAGGKRVLIQALHAADNEFVFANPGSHWVSDEEDGQNQFLRILGDPGTMVRCPEGDTTMRLDEGESAEGYYCPRHNALMEKVKQSFGRFDRVLEVLHEED
jgi:hypothetical protein